MLYDYYDSYGYKMPEHFVTMADIKKAKFAPQKRVSRKLTELHSFFTEEGQETTDLNQSPLLMKKVVGNPKADENDKKNAEETETETTLPPFDGIDKIGEKIVNQP